MSESAVVNVVMHLRETACRAPERTALVMPDDRRVSFGELWERVCRVSGGLREAGLRPGERMVVMIPMSVDLYTVMLGIIKLGAVAVFVDPWMPMRKIAAFAAFAEPRGFAGVGKSHLLRWMEPGLRRVLISLTTGRRLWGVPARFGVGDLLRAAPDPEVWEPETEDAPALITFTSGSSGTPKGANRTHGFLAAQYEALCGEYPYRDDDVDMPLFPVFALRNLAEGIPSVIPDVDFRRVGEVDGGRLLGQIAQHGVSTCTASPPFVERLAEAAMRSGGDPGLRRILTGGAPVSDAMLGRWRETFPETEIVVVYGSTEAEPVASIRLEERRDLRGDGEGVCVGRPVAAVNTRLIPIQRGPVRFTTWEDLSVPEGEVGELVVSGRHICRDYFRNSEAVRENKIQDAEGGWWHRMGDTGWMDGEGRFWLTGRVHTTILCKGTPLHAQVLEAAIAERTPGAVRVAALEHRERVVVVIQGGEKPDHLAHLQEAGIPVDELMFTDRPLPLDPRHQSKIDYAALRQRLEKGS